MKHEAGIDWVFITALVLLVVTGILCIYSASSSRGSIFLHQLFYYAAGAGLFYLGSVFPLRIIEESTPFLYALTLLLLILTVFFGGGPAGRWLQLGPLNIQASELAKFTVIILTARWLPAIRRGSVRGGVSLYFIAVGFLTVLTLLQPDLGTAVAIAMIIFGLVTGRFRFNWIFLS